MGLQLNPMEVPWNGLHECQWMNCTESLIRDCQNLKMYGQTHCRNFHTVAEIGRQSRQHMIPEISVVSKCLLSPSVLVMKLRGLPDPSQAPETSSASKTPEPHPSIVTVTVSDPQPVVSARDSSRRRGERLRIFEIVRFVRTFLLGKQLVHLVQNGLRCEAS